jgi:hypothetical protein
LSKSNDEDEEENDDVPNHEADNDNDSVMLDDSGSVPTAEAGEGNNVTLFGHTVQSVNHLTYDVKGNSKLKLNLVGAGICGGFINTQELHVMKHDEAMAMPDAEEREKSVDKEHKRMVNSNVFKATPLDEVPEDATILTETWV